MMLKKMKEIGKMNDEILLVFRKFIFKVVEQCSKKRIVRMYLKILLSCKVKPFGISVNPKFFVVM